MDYFPWHILHAIRLEMLCCPYSTIKLILYQIRIETFFYLYNKLSSFIIKNISLMIVALQLVHALRAFVSDCVMLVIRDIL
jgi:hypothetical protein